MADEVGSSYRNKSTDIELDWDTKAGNLSLRRRELTSCVVLVVVRGCSASRRIFIAVTSLPGAEMK